MRRSKRASQANIKKRVKRLLALAHRYHQLCSWYQEQSKGAACGIPSLMMGYGLEDGAARGIDEEVIYQPLGVFAAITPFNFPFMISFWFWPYAVATGNTFILKPSEQDPIVQRRVFELIEQAGFPPGVMNLVNGAHDAVNALLDHPK